MKAKTPKQVLQAVEWMITNVGWTQGTNYRDKNGKAISTAFVDSHPIKIGSMCLRGALNLVETDSPNARNIAKELIYKSIPMSITGFNDVPLRTKEQVIEAIHKAIKKA
jgi:hypothetical protein